MIIYHAWWLRTTSSQLTGMKSKNQQENITPKQVKVRPKFATIAFS